MIMLHPQHTHIHTDFSIFCMSFSLSNEICTFFALCCFLFWICYGKHMQPSGLLHWHCGSHMKYRSPEILWINTLRDSVWKSWYYRKKIKKGNVYKICYVTWCKIQLYVYFIQQFSTLHYVQAKFKFIVDSEQLSSSATNNCSLLKNNNFTQALLFLYSRKSVYKGYIMLANVIGTTYGIVVIIL